MQQTRHRMRMMRRTVWIGVLLAVTSLLVVVPPVSVRAVPFSSLVPRPALRYTVTGCTLDASSRGITSISQSDIDSYRPEAYTTGGCQTSGFLTGTMSIVLANNSLSYLPANVFANVDAFSVYRLVVNLATNRFNSSTIANFWDFSNSGTRGSCVFCGFNRFDLDLSFNSFGPDVPSAFQQATILVGTLSLVGTGITNIAPNAFAGLQVKNLDLSLNNLTSSGLHARSFDGILWSNDQISFLLLRNCRLRASSLPAGVFESSFMFFGKPVLSIDLSNLDTATNITATSDNGLPFDPFPARRMFSTRLFNPPGQAYAFRPPTAQQFDDSWGNFFDPFPAGVLSTRPADFEPWGYPLPLTNLRIGDVASFHPDFLAVNSTLSFQLDIQLAPHSVALALSGVAAEDYCPMHSLMRALSAPSGGSGESGSLVQLSVSAYDLPSPLDSPSNCVIPDCSSSGSFGGGGCRNIFSGSSKSVTLPTEPVFLQRAAVRWFASVGLTGASAALNMQPPMFGLWNPSLNRSDFAPVGLMCDLNVHSLSMPALPYTDGDITVGAQMPFPPPPGMLRCLARKAFLSIVDWTAATFFSSGTLAGFSDRTTVVDLLLNGDALYSGVDPVPLAFFDDGFSSLSPTISCAGATCARIASQCPYIVDKVCKLCPLGYWARGIKNNLYWYCSACTVGSYCNSTLTQQLQIDDLPLPCPQGSFQSDTTQSSCTLCPRGTYNGLTGRSDPSSCLLCPPGTANPSEGGGRKGDACHPCVPGSANGASGAAVCPTCPLGSYADTLESSSCILCPAGRFGTVTGANSSSLCESCPPSTPSSPAGSSSIQQCTGPVCSDGYYAALSTDVACSSQCPLGSSCAAGRITECAAGSYTDQPAQRSCTACGAGRVGSAGSTSATSCSACPISTYSSAAVSGACTPCPAGQVTAAAGSTSSAACQAIAGCETASTLTSNSSKAATLSYCPLAGRSSISLSSLLPGGLEQMRAYLQRADQIISQTSGSGESSTNATMSAAALEGVYATYSPLRYSESLRLAAFGSDATLDDFDALGIVAAKGRDPFAISTLSAPILSSATYFAIILAFLIIAFAPWLLYRYLPPRVVLLLDQFSLAHQVRAGKFVQQVPTQFGAITSWSFLWVAALVAILLATQSNTVSTIELLPPSAFSSQAGTAAANWQITLRAHTGESVSELSSWCNAATSSSLLSRQTGFSSAFTVRTSAATAGSCSVSADCLNCGLSASTALTSFTFPSSAQLIEWDLWVNSAQPSSWTRRYGVLTQLPGRLIDAHSSLHFSGMESYFNDERTPAFNKDARSGASARRSGFELSFLSFAVVEPQSAATFTASSKVSVSFSLQKSDVILHTRLSDKQTPLQLLTLIASAVVSLFSMFALAFRVLESRLIRGCGLSSGEVLPVEEDEQRKMQGVQVYAAGTSQTAATGGLVAAAARSPTATASSPARTVEMQRRQQQQQPLASPSAASQMAWGERK